MTAVELHLIADWLASESLRMRIVAQNKRAEELKYKFIVTDKHGQPLKLGGHKFAVEELASPSDLLEATRFASEFDAEKEAKRMMNLSEYRIMPLVPLDQQ